MAGVNSKRDLEIAPKNNQRFTRKYTETWPCIQPSKRGDFYAYCDICSCDFSIKHSGRYDVKVHINTGKHQGNTEKKSSNHSILNFIESTKCKDDSSINAECLMANFIIEHNLPIAISDHLSPLVKKMFPDSKIAKQFACKRTKTTQIIHEMASDCQSDMSGIIEDSVFSISTDGSSDRGCEHQLYPMVIRYYDKNAGKILTGLLSLPSCEGASTGENIFQLMDGVIREHTSWTNCIGYCSDNAAVMMGTKKGVAAFVVKEHKNIFITGCTCHLIHLAASKAAKELSPVKIEEVLVDIFYYIDKSSKRHKLLKEFQELCGTDPHKIIKHCATRWLSLEGCINRLLEQWLPLKLFFEKETQPIRDKAAKIKIKILKKQIDSGGTPVAGSGKRKTSGDTVKEPSSKKTCGRGPVNCNTSNTSTSEGTGDTVKVRKVEPAHSVKAKPAQSEKAKPAQSEKAKPAQSEKAKPAQSEKAKPAQSEKAKPAQSERVFAALTNPKTKLFCLFLQATTPVFNAMNLLLQSDEPQIHLLLSKCTDLLTDLLVKFVKPAAIAGNNIMDLEYGKRENQKDRDSIVIGNKTREYLDVCKKAKTMASEDRTEFFTCVRNYYSAAVKYILLKFPLTDPLLTHATVADMTKRNEAKFTSVKYFIQRFPCILPANCNIDVVEMQFLRYQVEPLPKDVSETKRIDTAWHTLSQLKGADMNLLCRLMLGILVIPHSNADSERIFSCVRKNSTEFRPNLGRRLLESLMVTKTYRQATNPACYTQEFSENFLVSAKKATYKSLKKDQMCDTVTDMNMNVIDSSAMISDILNMCVAPPKTKC